MLGQTNPKSWVWAWVVAELVRLSVLSPAPAPPKPALLLCPGKGWGQLSFLWHLARNGTGSPVLRSPGPALQHCPGEEQHQLTRLWQLARSGSSSPIPTPPGPALSYCSPAHMPPGLAPLCPCHFGQLCCVAQARVKPAVPGAAAGKGQRQLSCVCHASRGRAGSRFPCYCWT